MSDATWRPGASLKTLQQISQLRTAIRQYMHHQQVMEVVTPALSIAATTDPNIHSFKVNDLYLHTSPEFPMKRLLAAYAQDIYQIATVFRDGEAGRYHNAEFSLLEWYRVGMDHVALMDDVSAMFEAIFKQFNMDWQTPNTIRYTEAVSGICRKSFDQIAVEDIEQVFSQHNRSYPQAIGNDLDAAMDLLMDEFVVASFPTDRATFVIDYPASQAALARVVIDKDNLAVAERFELFLGPLELANGFHELSESQEQRERFEHDQNIRAVRQDKAVPMDEHLLNALSHGLPDCAGVAVGLDRLMMLISGAKHIDEVLAFSSNRA